MIVARVVVSLALLFVALNATVAMAAPPEIFTSLEAPPTLQDVA